MCLATVLVASGCATSHLEEFNEVEMGNATPADSPAFPGTEEGTVVDVGGNVVSLTPLGGDDVAAKLDSPPRLQIGEVSPGGEWDETASVDLPESTGPVGRGSDGSVAIPVRDGVLLVSGDGEERTVSGLGDVTAAVELDDGRIVTGDEEGTVTVRDSGGVELNVLTGMEAIDQIVVADGDIMAVSRVDTTVSYIDPEGDFAGPILRAGKAAGLAYADPAGFAAVSDSTGDAVMVFNVEPLRMHQWFPVPSTPWGVATDGEERMLWVTTTEDNRLLGYDLGSGLGEQRADVQTVSQPNSVVVTESGTTVVGSAAGDGLHVVTPDLAPAESQPGQSTS